MSLAMLNHSVASMARVPGGRYHDIKEKFWGIELTKEKLKEIEDERMKSNAGHTR